MKKLQKIIAFLLAALTAIVFAMPAVADGTGDTAGETPSPAAASPSITINNAAPGKEYRVYKIFDVEVSADGSGYSYSIRSDSPWYDTVNTFATDTANNLVLTAIDTDDTATPVITIYNVAHESFNDKNAADFLEALKTYESSQSKVTDAGITKSGYYSGTAPDAATVPSSGTTLTIPVNDYGYYFVSTSIGALCILDTAAPTMTVVEKNAVPDIEKYIVDDKDGNISSSSGRIFDGTKDVDSTTKEVFDDIIKFRLIVSPNISLDSKATGQYIVHDVLSDGLELYTEPGNAVKGNFKIQEVVVGASGSIIDMKDVPSSYYTIEYDKAEHDIVGSTDKMACDFHITFTKEFSASLTDEHIDHRIRIEYEAILNKNAIDKTPGSDPTSSYTEINKARLQYGDNYYTGERSATVNTYRFGIYKIDSTSENPLDGAEFKLYLDKDCTKEVPLVKIVPAEGKTEAEGYNVNYNSYRPAVAGETGVTVETLKGYAEIWGLSSKTTYFLKEVAPPDGYKLLGAPVQISNLDDTMVATKKDDGTTDYSNAVRIKNSTGQELPTTGGMGTRLFYIFGGALVFIAGVLLITKKRMSKVK